MSQIKPKTQNGLGLGEPLGSTISGTPRTDAHIHHIMLGPPGGCEMVPSSVSRTLERELATEKETAKRWEATAWEQGMEIIRLKKALANLLSVYDGTDKQEQAGEYAREARHILSNNALTNSHEN